MGIGGITSANSMSVMQMTSSNVTDSRSKNIQKEITDTQQQMQKLSSKEDLSANEKSQERKALQKEISDLNT
ncbi:MAG: FlxA-like family protein, partial [Lachnospiraceae bacterium]|nr:FlxA-like family protein [Lachnospiraceae bacterium]